jgi:hypothetical protein
MRAVVILLMIAGSTAFAELDYKQLAATKRDQPPLVMTTEAIAIAIPYGTAEMPKGVEVKLLSVSDDGKLTVQYGGQQYQILASQTDIENRVTEIRSHRLIVGGIEYQNFRFDNQTPAEVTIIHPGGRVTVNMADLPPFYQKQLGYDAEAARKYLEEQQYVGKFAGTQTWPDGAKYVGQFKDNRCNGRGVLTFPDGTKYMGEFQEGMENGKGMLTWPDGTAYVGRFKDGKLDGQGTETWTNGAVYVGQFRGGKKDGVGRMSFPTGVVQEGLWTQGQFGGAAR